MVCGDNLLKLGKHRHRVLSGATSFRTQRVCMNALQDDNNDVTAISQRSLPPQSEIRPSVVAADSAPAEQRQSAFARLRRWFRRFGANVVEVLNRPRLTDHLPALPSSVELETTQVSPRRLLRMGRYEQLLIDILLAPTEYVSAAVLVGRTAESLRRQSDDVYAEGVVHFALSRMQPDSDGTVPLSRLRNVLDDLPVPAGLFAVLLRLEAHGVIEIVTPCEGNPTAGMISTNSMRVRLLVLP